MLIDNVSLTVITFNHEESLFQFHVIANTDQFGTLITNRLTLINFISALNDR